MVRASAWAPVSTEDGSTYYHNEVTGEVSWTPYGDPVKSAFV